MRNFYSVSISGYHIAEAGANPISQLAFTLANGFTYVESYLARGMDIDDFAPNLSFFFSNGMDPEYTRDRPGGPADLGRRHARPLRRRTSGRRSSSTTCRPRAGRCTRRRWTSTTSAPRCRRCARSTTTATRLHTNAYDEAVTTPTAGVGAPGAGHPADHQPGVGPVDEREPAAGLVHRRRAHRPGRGGGARRVRAASPSAAACSARWRPATSAAGSRTSRCSTSSASTTARCRSSASTRSCEPGRRRRRRRTIELARATEEEKQSQLTGWPTSRPGTPARPRPRMRRLQDVATGEGNVFDVLMAAARRLLAGPDHQRVLRGRRPVPAQHVSPMAPLSVRERPRGYARTGRSRKPGAGRCAGDG